jgi:hypothetical protein
MMNTDKVTLYQTLNILLGRCGELRHDFHRASFEQTPDAYENYVAALMAVRTMADSLLEIDSERRLELQTIRDMYHAEILRMQGVPDTTGFWKSRLTEWKASQAAAGSR